MSKMRAARLVEPGRMVCEDAPVLEPAPGQVVVRTHMAAICGSDLHQVFMRPLGATSPPAEPGWPGHEGVGEVVESNSEGLAAGDLVLTVPGVGFQRCFADYQTLPGAWCLRLPAYDGPVEDLLMAQQFGTTIFALRRGNLDFVEAVMDETGGRGAHIVIEAVGRNETIEQAIDVARPHGNVVYFGLPESVHPVPFSYATFFVKQLRMYAVVNAQAEEDLVSFRKALDWIARREIDVTRMVSHRLPLKSIGHALLLAHERDEDALKVTLTF